MLKTIKVKLFSDCNQACDRENVRFEKYYNQDGASPAAASDDDADGGGRVVYVVMVW